MLEFKINKFLTLKLENNRTTIYVKNNIFFQCKYILLNINSDEIEDHDDINSIDEAMETLDHSLEKTTIVSYKIPPKARFWGHCSNLQAWIENKYDTRLLHSNLAFPLLKTLTEEGDPQAKKVFKDEIAKRFMSNYLPVIIYLIENNYLSYLNKKELKSLIDFQISLLETNPKNTTIWFCLGYLNNMLKNFEEAILAYKRAVELDENDAQLWHYLALTYKKKKEYDKAIMAFKHCLSIKPDYYLIWEDIDNLGKEPKLILHIMKNISKGLKETLLHLLISRNNENPERDFSNSLNEVLLKSNIPFVKYRAKIFLVKDDHLKLFDLDIDDIMEIEGLNSHIKLKSLNFHYNQISEIRGLETLKNLSQLYLNYNLINEIKGLEHLHELKTLNLKHNQIFEIDGLKNLLNLEYLDLSNNRVTEIKHLSYLKNLKILILSSNQISEIKGLQSLSNLEILDLRYNGISKITGLENLPNLKKLYLSDNQISEKKEFFDEKFPNCEVFI